MVGVEDLQQETLLAGCCPGLRSPNRLPFPTQKPSPTGRQGHGDMARGLVFASEKPPPLTQFPGGTEGAK